MDKFMDNGTLYKSNRCNYRINGEKNVRLNFLLLDMSLNRRNYHAENSLRLLYKLGLNLLNSLLHCIKLVNHLI